MQKGIYCCRTQCLWRESGISSRISPKGDLAESRGMNKAVPVDA